MTSLSAERNKRKSIFKNSINIVNSPQSLSKKQLTFFKLDIPTINTSDTKETNDKEVKRKEHSHTLSQKKQDKILFPEIAEKKVNEITLQLFNLGYSIEAINITYKKYKFKSIDQATEIMGFDDKINKYNHTYYNKSNEERICIICSDIESKHIEDINMRGNYYDGFSDSNIIVNEKGVYKSSKSNKNKNLKKNLNDGSVKGKSLKSGSKVGQGGVIEGQTNEEENEVLKHDNHHKIIVPSQSFLDKLEEEFNSENLCPICCSVDLNIHNSGGLKCGHKFCLTCLESYLKTNITSTNKNILDLKCLRAGCIERFEDKHVKKYCSTLYEKYLIYKERFNLKIKSKNLKLIGCPYPDCPEYIHLQSGESAFVQCKLKHKFCVNCQEKWHHGRSCSTKNIDKIVSMNENIRICPNCCNFIEKDGGCNHMACCICNYEFCWLCMKKYAFYHYFIFNINGCPLKRNYEANSLSYWDSPVGKGLSKFLTGILFLFFVILYVSFLCCFGACMELAIFYLKNKVFAIVETNEKEINVEEQDEEEIIPTNILSYDTKGEGKSIQGKDIVVIICLVILGFVVQPFYIIYKLVKYLIVVYHRLGFLCYDCNVDCGILVTLLGGS